ncbi:hypothetical protein [Pandoraea terrigena]|uniref:Uncharacterized protein n=1 Tax=Pandoraea terrigena TaxID=2508292 RepID=A0A5E4YV40_9BURK|nr:hypothetical protein [Pandoraea terrigena]VVE52616.1 hypothetical protein PTE31013_04827 [Pandoraea terrigena]
MKINENQQVADILAEALEKLEALGLKCAISPNMLPKGESLSLHVGNTLYDVGTGFVASMIGGAAAHEAGGSAMFDDEVEQFVRDREAGDLGPVAH